MWLLVALDQGRRQHIVPVADLVHHEESDRCVCRPLATRRVSDDGQAFTQWVHSAADGRDQ